VAYSTLLGGSGDDYGLAIAVDSSGNAYVTGTTSSSTFAGAPSGGAQTTTGGSNDAYVAKLNSGGTALLYFTFLGGSGLQSATAIALDSSSNAYIGGVTTSSGLATGGAAQTTLAGVADSFIAKLNAGGTTF